MSATLVKLDKIPSASKEAYFSWEIDESISFKKGMLCLTDIDQDGDDDSKIFKYQLHSTESPAGAHIFEDLHAGEYYARLTIIDLNDVGHTSTLQMITVYELGKAEILDVIPTNSRFEIKLKSYTGELQQAHGTESLQTLSTVTFVLFGRKTIASGLATGTDNSINLNIVKPYNSNNTYFLGIDNISGINDNIKNYWQYEIACFYTDNKNVSGDLSDTKVSSPSPKPNKIKDVVATYDYLNRRLIINYTNPSDYNYDDFVPVDLKATIKYTDTAERTNINHFSYTSGFNFDNEEIVFDNSSSPMLPIDNPFTITLNMMNTAGYSDFESDAITCIVPSRFCSEPTTITDVQYIVGDNNFSVTYAKANLDKYNVRVRMVITLNGSTQSVHENDNYVTGTIIPVVNGTSYKVNLQVFYTAKINSSIVFGPSTADVPHHDRTFIPHGQADAPSNLSVVYGDGTATLSWAAPNFYGYILDHYELSTNGGSSWINNDSNLNYIASCNVVNSVYNSGTMYPFLVRAVTKSPNAGVYAGTERTNGQTSSIAVYPLKKPEAPIIDSHVPGDSKCDIIFHDRDYFGGIKQHYKYTISNAQPGQISYNSTSTSFTGLTNDQQSTISISLVTKSGPDNVQESEQVTFVTTPFVMPIVPTLSAKPWTNYVDLTWLPNDPLEILDKFVEYDVRYKHFHDRVWITRESVTSPLRIDGLTSNTEYEFKIRSKIYNEENHETLPSEYSTPITSRPFIYANAPTMELSAGNGTITVIITPPLDLSANLYAANMYHATVDPDPDTNGDIVIQTLNSSNSTLIFNVGNSGLVNLEKYKVVAWYDMLSPGITEPYESNTVSNSVTPFDKTNVPYLYSDPEDGKITFSWTDEGMHGLVITGYEVSSKLYTSSTWGAWEFNSVAECNKSVSTTQDVNDYKIVRNHPNGTKMSYKIRAVILNAGKTYHSDDSLEAVATPYTYASAPTLVSYVSSSGKITLSWNQPSNLGGLPLKRYEVSKDSGLSWTSNNNSTTSDFTGLTNGTLYTFKVRAVTDNSDNMAQDSNLDTVLDIISSNVLSQNARPYAVPTISLNSVISGDGTLTLKWTRSLGGHAFARYFMYLDGVISGTTASSDLEFRLDNLINGTAYACAVRVDVLDENDNAGSMFLLSTTSLSKTNIPYVAAVPPKNVTSVPSNGSVRVSWDDLTPSELGGLPLKRYEVQKDNESDWTQPSGDLYHDFQNLNNGTEYTFKVHAVTRNQHYTSDPNITTDEVIGAEASKNDIPYLPLDAPSIISCVPDNKTATLSWSEPPLVGLSLHHYEVSGGVLTAPLNVDKSTNYTFSDLLNNTPYSFYVKAVATHTYYVTQTSGNSLEATTIPFVKPNPVTSLSCSAINGSGTVYFEAPASVNGDAEQRFKYSFDPTTNIADMNSIVSGNVIDVSQFGTTQFSLYVYTYIKNPNNEAIIVSSDPAISPTTNNNLGTNITNYVLYPGDKSMRVTWEDLNNVATQSSPVTYKCLIFNMTTRTNTKYPDVVAHSPSDLTTTFNNLDNGTSYTFCVYSDQNHVAQEIGIPVGLPIINSVSNSGSVFNVNVNFNGDTKAYITIIGITSDSLVEIIGPTSYSNTLNTITISGPTSSSYSKYVVIVSNSIGSVKYESA